MTQLCPQPFHGLTGKSVRIAIIDSGVHAGHDHIHSSRITEGCSVLRDGQIMTPAAMDRIGHGTAVTAAIQEIAPDTICIPVQVFTDSLKTTPAAILSAIRWAVAQNVDIINLSLGSRNAARQDVFSAAAEEANRAGVIVVSARTVDGERCYPGALPSVVGVDLDWACHRLCYGARQHKDEVFFFASGYPRPIPGVPLRRNIYGVSFAVAQISGFIARAVEQSAQAGKIVNLANIKSRLRHEVEEKT